MRTPRDDVSKLTARQLEIFKRASKEYPEQRDKMRLLAYLHDSDWDEDISHDKMEELSELVQGMAVPSVEEVSEFYEMRDSNTPPPCIAILEDGEGDCARDREGSPIIVMFGALEGSGDDMVKQLAFIISRCDRFFADTEMPKVAFVTDLGPRKGLHNMNKGDMKVGNFMKKFPMSFTSYTCGVETWMDDTVKKATALIPEGIFQKYKIDSGYGILEDAFDVGARLPWWNGGSLNFSMRNYLDILRKL